MERLPKGLYSPEFQAEAVKLVEQKGMSIDRGRNSSRYLKAA